MKTCELCKSQWSDDTNFCGQCGRRMGAPGEPSGGNDITFVSVCPVQNDLEVPEAVSRHDTPITGEDEDGDREILHTYDDVDGEHASTIVHENTEEEEDEEESKFAPFLPMPGSGPVQ